MKSRVSRFKYGIATNVPYNPYDPEHAERSAKAIFTADGIKRLPNAFSTILEEVRLQTHPPTSRSYHMSGNPCFRNRRVSESLLHKLKIATEPRPTAADINLHTYAPSPVDDVYPGDYTGLPQA